MSVKTKPSTDTSAAVTHSLTAGAELQRRPVGDKQSAGRPAPKSRGLLSSGERKALQRVVGDMQSSERHVTSSTKHATRGTRGVTPKDGQSAKPSPSILAMGAKGELALIEQSSPWRVLAKGTLGLPAVSARYRHGRFVIIHPAPASAVSIVSAADLKLENQIRLSQDADPQDVAFVDDETAVVSLRGSASLIKLNVKTLVQSEISLAPLAAAEGENPEATMLASSGRRVFVELARAKTDATGEGRPALGVIDVGTGGDPDRIVDADRRAPGLQGIALVSTPAFDMDVDTVKNRLLVTEPASLMLGDSRYEVVDLRKLTARAVTQPQAPGQAGPALFTGKDKGWLIMHTEFGPAPSSHLGQFGPDGFKGVYDTFAASHVDNLAYDAKSGLVFFPDPGKPDDNGGRTPGVRVFDARTGESLTPEAVDVGFAPLEVITVR